MVNQKKKGVKRPEGTAKTAKSRNNSIDKLVQARKERRQVQEKSAKRGLVRRRRREKEKGRERSEREIEREEAF